jgi:hypothetical protein
MSGKKCEYGCGKEAKYQFKNGKWCCSDSYNKCPGMREKNSKSNKGKIFSDERKKNISNSLKGRTFSTEHKEKLSKIRKGRKAWNRGIPQTEETKKKISSSNKGKKKTEETCINISNALKGIPKSKKHRKKMSQARMGRFKGEDNPFYGKTHDKKTIEKIVNHKNSKKFYKKQKKYMLNGGAAYLNSFIKNPSKPQVELYNIVLELCPYAILNYPCLNYSIDIAIPFLNIAIEYDEPYWHQNGEYDEKRQRELEKEGWNFIRFSKIPRKRTIKKIFI